MKKKKTIARKPPKRAPKKKTEGVLTYVHSSAHRGMLAVYLEQLRDGLLTSDDLRKQLTSSRQAIADWMKLGTPYAKQQAAILTKDIPALKELFEAAVEQEKKIPAVG